MLSSMTWVFWAVLSAVFAAATALLAKVGVSGVDSNLATAIRTTVILVFTWAIAIGFEKHHALTQIGRRSWVILGAWLFLGEQLTPLKIGGASLITIGAVILAFA